MPLTSTRTTVSPREAVMFYPSYGYRVDADTWSIVVQGCVFHEQITWFRRKPVLSVIRRAMRIGRDADGYFERRMRRFLVHFSAGRYVTVRLGRHEATFGPSELAGLFRGELQITSDDLGSVPLTAGTEPRWISYSAELPDTDVRQFVGRAQLLDRCGTSVISDVDDTLKHSNVPNRRDLFHNTFVRDFVPIPGMPQLYRESAAAGAAFHYVSGSPWQLYEPLAEFWDSQGYPPGSFHLKRFRLRETARKMRGMSPQQAHKQAAIEPILAAFPERRFILIGDSGEQDPEIYAYFLRHRPQQIAHVFIRTVRGMMVDRPRLERTFAETPSDAWTPYETADEIHDLMLRCVRAGESADARPHPA